MKVKALLYCCKDKPYLHKTQSIFDNSPIVWQLLDYDYYKKSPYSEVFGTLVCDLDRVNGEIVCECEVETEEFSYTKLECLTHKYLDLLKHSCLTDKQMYDYFKGKNGYVLHLSNVKVFDKPKELSDFTTRKPRTYDSIVCDSCTDFGFNCKECSYLCEYQQVKKAPQNMQWCWVYENGKWVKYLIISIRPQWLCKILNGEKDLELRRKVLKGMCD